MHELIGKTPKITPRLLSIVLIVDIYFILKYGKSPAFLDTSQLIQNLGTELFYFPIIMFSIGVWLFVPLAISYLILSNTFYWVISSPYRHTRYYKISRKWHARRKILASEILEFAIQTEDTMLEDRIKTGQSDTGTVGLSIATSFSNFLLLIVLVSISSQNHPNFLMLTCSIFDATNTCSLYFSVITMILIGSVFMQAISFRLLIGKMYLPNDFSLSDNKKKAFKEFNRKHSPKMSFMEAKAKYMRGN